MCLNHQNFKNNHQNLTWTPTLKSNFTLRSAETALMLHASLLSRLTQTLPRNWYQLQLHSLITLTLLPGLSSYFMTIHFKLYGIWTNNWTKGCQYWALKSVCVGRNGIRAYSQCIGVHDLKYFLPKPFLGIFLGGRQSRVLFFKALRLFSYNWQPWNHLSTKRLGYQTSIIIWTLIPFWNEYYFRVYNL